MHHRRPFFTTLVLGAIAHCSLQTGCVSPDEVEQANIRAMDEDQTPASKLRKTNPEADSHNPFLYPPSKPSASDAMEEACALNLRAERLFHVPPADDYPKHEDGTPTGDWREYKNRPDYAWDLLGRQEKIEQTLQEIALQVCKTLYRDPSEVQLDPNKPLVLSFQPNRGSLAWAIERRNEYRIVISTLAEKIPEYSEEKYIDELKGIMAHEMTHIYQYDDEDGKKEAERLLHGDEKLINLAQRSRMVEGIADFVRTQTGWVKDFSEIDRASQLGEWGEPFVTIDPITKKDKVEFNGPTYQGLGWFFTWLEHKDPGIAYRLNQSMDSFDGRGWTFERFKDPTLTGHSVQYMWNKYREWANQPLCSNACGGAYFCESLIPEKCGKNNLGMQRCVDKPGACIQIYKPVCGCDGKTYSNACFAAQAGVSLRARVSCEDFAENLRTVE